MVSAAPAGKSMPFDTSACPLVPGLVPARKSMLKALDEGKMTREMRVNIVADNCLALYQQTTLPSLDAMRAMAKRIISSYPIMANQMSPKEVIMIHLRMLSSTFIT